MAKRFEALDTLSVDPLDAPRLAFSVPHNLGSSKRFPQAVLFSMASKAQTAAVWPLWLLLAVGWVLLLA